MRNFSSSVPKTAAVVCYLLGKPLNLKKIFNIAHIKKAAPVQLHGLEGRYAHAIYSAAVKKNQLEAVDKDFQNILVLNQIRV